MTEDKILAFLNLKKEQAINKTLIGITFWFDFSFTLAIILFGLLLNVFELNFSDCIFFVGCITTVFCSILWYKKATNPTNEISFPVYVLFISTVKLFYGYLRFSNREALVFQYPQFGWLHLMVMVVFILVVFYMWWKFYHVFRDLKKHTLEQARKNIEKKQLKVLWIPIFVGSPMILVRLLRNDLIDLKLGVGFCLWSLSCIWMCLFLMLLPKYIVMKKYKIADILSKSKGNSSMS